MSAIATSAAAGADVTALIVAADSGPLLGACIDALLRSPRVACVRLADNASHDGQPQALALQHAGDRRFELVENARNLGFGAAVNQVARKAETPWLAIVNPDCLLQPTALDALLQVGAEHPEAGLIGALIVDADGQVEPASRRRDPLLRRVLSSFGLTRGEAVNMPSHSNLHAPASGTETARTPHHHDAVNDSTHGTATIEAVEAVSGAMMLVRREVFEQLHGFDEGYFLHFEDLDLCRRVRDAGREVLLSTQVRVIHTKGSSSRHRPVFVDWHKHRGMWRWLRKFDPAMRNPLLAAAAWCGIWTHFLVNLPRHLLRRNSS